MLSLLRIKNLAIVKEAELEFTPGFNIITGETGAGKSIVLKAIELLTGKKASVEIVGSAAPQCIVEGLFYLSSSLCSAITVFNEDFIPSEEDAIDKDNCELVIKRIVDSSGRSRAYINGQLISLTQLTKIAAFLIDITSQHEQTMLLNREHHLTLLDLFGVSTKLCSETAEAFKFFSKAERELKTFQDQIRESTSQKSNLTLELEELEKANLKEGEKSKLEEQLKKLANLEVLSSGINQSLELIEGTEGGIDHQVRLLSSNIERIARLDPDLKDVCALIDAASAQLSEVRLLLLDYGSALDSDPQKAEFLRDRINDIARLERKYRLPLDKLIDYQHTLRNELEKITNCSLYEQQLQHEKEKAEAIFLKLQSQLHDARETAGISLSSKVEDELVQLNMKRARFKVNLTPARYSTTGGDAVEFVLAANPGEPFQPLIKVASGGELSRILLVLKTLLNARNNSSVQIFDEIDSGIGGITAHVVGEKLKLLSCHSQIIVVTHSPQVAAFADNHLLIHKHSTTDSTTVNVKVLKDEARIKHIAGMMAGKKVTSNFEDSARELINHSRAIKTD